jgi:hemerythrin
MVSAVILTKMIEDEHALLLGMLNGIQVASDFMDVISYFTKHAIDEEDIMRKCNYPHYYEHKSEHSRILLNLSSYKTRNDVDRLRKTVNNIIVEHVTNFDQAILSFISNLDSP